MGKGLMVIPDIHGRAFWKDSVTAHGNDVDKIIFLGDYVDRYEDEGISRKDELNNFKEIVKFKLDNADKVVLLLGNHCLHYIFDSFPRSTRYSSSNAYTYRDIYTTNRNLFKLAHEETIDNRKYLFTHAGVMRSWYERNKNIIGELNTDNLNRLITSRDGVTSLSDISKYRTYIGYDTGSILWSDIREKLDLEKSGIDNYVINEDSIVDGYDYQIFGHTQLVDSPVITDKWACIDCRVPFLITDGKLERV